MNAIKIEYVKDNTRLLIFEINEETGYASVLDIVESDEDNIPALAHYLQTGYPDINAVLVDESQEGAEPVGEHFVCIPDCLGVFELAEILAKRKAD